MEVLNLTNKNITLNAWKNNNEVAVAVQGEVDSRFLNIKLEDNDGPINLSNKTVKFLARKPDGTVIFNNMTINNAEKGITTLELTSQMSAVPGILDGCEVHIISENGETLILKKINIYIQESLGPAIEESISELTAYQELVNKVNKNIEHSSSQNNPHNVTAAQVGALLDSTKYGYSLETDGTTLILKDQDNNILSTVNTQDTTYAAATTLLDGLMSASDKLKLDNIADNTNVNVQSDWNQPNANSDDYIKNKPTIPSEITDLNGILPINKGGTGGSTVVSALEHLQTYTTVEQLGLSYPCTSVQIIKKMPVNSEVKIAINNKSNSITDLPTDYCLLTIRYNALNRYQIFCTNMTSVGSTGIYFGNYVRNENVTWEKIFTDNKIIPISNGGTGSDTSEGALTALGAAKSVDIGDVSTLNTNNKTIVSAINELYALIQNYNS